MPTAIAPLDASLERLDAEVGASTSRVSPQRIAAEGDQITFARKLSQESARQVQATRTPMSTETARSAIARAYHELVGTPLSPAGSAILTAHWAHETGHGASMYNFNFGGIKGVGPSGLTVAQRTREGYGQTERRIVDNFRAYGSVDEGAKDYVKLLLNRYGTAVASAERGDAAAFVRGLKDKGYFTGDPAAYERNVVAIANRVAGASGEASIGMSRPVHVATGPPTPPNENVQATPVVRDVQKTPHTSAAWQQAPMPLALFEVAGIAVPADEGTGMADVTATRALAMVDEITRAALRIAVTDGDDQVRSRVPTASSTLRGEVSRPGDMPAPNARNS